MANNPQYSGVQPPPTPIAGSMDPTRNFAPLIPVQFRPVVPAQQAQQFAPVVPQPFHHVSRGVTAMGTGFPPQTQQPQYTPLVQHLPARAGQPGFVPAAPVPPVQPNMHVASGAPRPQPNAQTPNNYTPGVGPPGSHLSSSYTFASSYGQVPLSLNAVPQYQSMNQVQVHAPSVSAGSQMGISGSQSNAPSTPLKQTSEQPSVTTSAVSVPNIQAKSTEEAPTDWIEHTSANGRKYYYNKRTRQSCWEKPWVLMTCIERADASTNWKEFTSPDGRKYYYNKATNQSTWSIPEELKLAREQLDKGSGKATQSEMFSYISTQAAPEVKAPAGVDASSATIHGAASSPVPVAPVAATSNIELKVVSGPSTSPISTVVANTDEVQSQTTSDAVASSPAAASESRGFSVTIVNADMTPVDESGNASIEDVLGSKDGVVLENVEGMKKDVVVFEKVFSVLEEKSADQEPLTYVNKQEAKNAFKALLESSNVGPDWPWDQVMRVIINDKRYGALRTLGERKQAFNEFLAQKKKQEAEERRNKQKRACEEFRIMLEESTELTSSTRWSKLQTMFEDDDRFKAVEREKDRKDMFENYIEELKQKERVKAQEERKRNITEYRKFLESSDFIKASSQWRKVQDRLETDERCSRLDKIDRLEIFQEYLRDLEKEEEEQKKIQKEELRKAERKNRDDFRKLMEDHVASGILTAKAYWRDYFMMVKDLPAFVAVASNTSGSTPKDLFEDATEELQKQYHDDKSRVKDAVKLKKVSISSTWTLDDLKATVMEDVSSPPISDVNFKLIFDDLLERAKEKEEKEAKKRKRLADDFSNFLHAIKELNSSSTWENCKYLFESSQEFSTIGDESLCRDIFEEYITKLKEEAKDNEQRRKEEKAKKDKDREEREKRKARHGRGKESGREREKDEYIKDGETDDVVDIDDSNANKRSGRDGDRKHRKRHRSSADDLNESEKDQTKHSHHHRSDHKKSKRHESTVESDSESRHKRHRREHRNGSRRSGDHEELEDGEFGDERESR